MMIILISSWKHNPLNCIIIILLTLFIVRSGAASSYEGSLLGVAPQDENYYFKSTGGTTIKCKDGSHEFSKSQLNDDFCDCPDGTDEPGTSACPNGRFYCKNAGHAPLILYSSRVNDGICDCCDGSDEYDGKVKCVNTCWEAGKVAREKLKKKIETYRGGVTIRKREIEQAKLSIAKEETELAGLKDEEKILKKLVEQLKDRKELIEKAEEKERQQKEKEDKERMEAEAAKEKDAKAEEKPENLEHAEHGIHDEIGTVDQPSQVSAEDHRESASEPELSSDPIKVLPLKDEVAEVKDNILQNTDQLGQESNVDGLAGIDKGKEEKKVAESTESLSREELGRLVASRWTGEKNEQQTQEEDASVSKDQPSSDETPNETSDEEYNGYDSEDDEHKYEDDHEDPVDDFAEDEHSKYDSSSTYKSESEDEADLSDSTTGSSSSSWLEKIQQTATNIFRAVNPFQTPVNTSDAAHVRKEYDENSAKLSKIQSRISSLTKKLNQDFGPEKEFYSFYGQCFEGKENKYVYKVCPFKQATQEEGHSVTRLGSWEKFEDSYRTIQFSNGDKCWNGPDRSLKVKLRCGLKIEVTDVDEPSRCEYVALLSTPALCVDAKLKELEQKLESMNKEQPQAHDEL